ncbi:hypothetical protein HNP46_005516 [Pseudomonas nitritireducens]|uniref:Uncharacterized protein n=1 Tax=Pseudomonas nitroreducens TaxID=46680 RepID=A0A7W7KQ57_PSENT|nr:hypothetical protein [Pseudomonas nitritireducens]
MHRFPLLQSPLLHDLLACYAQAASAGSFRRSELA